MRGKLAREMRRAANGDKEVYVHIKKTYKRLRREGKIFNA